MKKLITICLVALTLPCIAQDILPFTYGPIVSMTGTSLSNGSDVKDQVTGTGYNVGGFVRVKVLMLYTEAELNYGSKSVSVTLDNNGNNINSVYKLKGLDASLILGLKLIGLGENANLRLFAGYNYNNYSDISFSVNGEKYDATGVGESNSSILGGVGCDLWKFALNLKYQYGLTDLASSGSSEVKTRIVNLSLAYRFK